MMLAEVKAGPAFSHLHIALNPGEQIFAQPDTVIGFETGLEIRTILAESHWRAFAKKCMGNPLLRVTRLRNIRDATRRLMLSPPTPGALVAFELNNQSFQVQPDAVVACTQGVELADRLRNSRTPITCNGRFYRVLKGRGRVWLATFGALVEKEIDGELTINSEYLVTCESSIFLCRHRSRLAGGMIRLRGRGKLLMQTRSCAAMTRWLYSER